MTNAFANPKSDDARLVLYYPTKAAATKTIYIRAPEFGNSDGTDMRTVQDMSAAGELIAYTRGPKFYPLQFEVPMMKRADRDALQDFFENYTLGSVRTFELRVPRYDLIMEDGSISQWTLFTGCQFETGALLFTEPRNGWYSTTLSIRAKAKSAI